jgi:thiosulfate/3-mercaptopyruvate sulfurtransferase
MMPPAAQFADAMASYGISDHSCVVLYDTGMNMWAARVWWMLRAFGFQRAAILNGGWKKWTAEQRPTSSGPGPARPRGKFTARLQPRLIADWSEVHAGLSDPDVRLVNALSADEHSGKVTRTRRPGHIPGSVNVPAGSLVDPSTNAYLEPARLRTALEPAMSSSPRRIVTYCGGGIAACSDAFALTLLGAKDVAVYDGSLVDWSSRPELPLSVTEDARS